MKFAAITGWVEEHPTESIVIGAGGLIAILWLLGYFGSSASASSSGASSLASAYYAAEAQQAVVGGQIQMNTANDATQAAVATTQANAAVAINAAQYGAATTINSQNASAATTIDAQDDLVGTTASNNALLATYSNNNAAVATNASNNATAASIGANNNWATLMGGVINNLIPTELAYSKGSGVGFTISGVGQVGGAMGSPTPAIAAQQGYTPSQIQAMFPQLGPY